MKYIVILADGMSDYPIEELGGRTPLESSKIPNMTFMAKNGKVGLGLGKANVVAQAIQKGRNKAIFNMEKVPVINDTIPHEVIGRADSTRVKLMPARPGTGIIAGAVARAILDGVGVANILTKVYGSKNPMNVARATMDGLKQLRNKEVVEKLRGVSLS